MGQIIPGVPETWRVSGGSCAHTVSPKYRVLAALLPVPSCLQPFVLQVLQSGVEGASPMRVQPCVLTEDERSFIRNVHFISLFLRGLVARWLVGAAADLGVVWGWLFFFCCCCILLCGHGCEVRVPPPASPGLAVNSAHFEIRRLGYSSLEMLPAVLLLSERSQIKTSLEGISE